MGVVWAREQGNKVGLKRDKEWLKVELCIHVIIAKKHSAFLCPEYSGNSATRVNNPRDRSWVQTHPWFYIVPVTLGVRRGCM